MAKDTQGKKIQDNESVRKKIIEWIILEPSITDYMISKRLKQELNYKTSQPSVASWRKNYFQSSIENQTKVFSNSDISKKIDLKLNSLGTINSFIEKFKGRATELEKILPKYDAVETESEPKEKVIYVKAEHLEVEEQYQASSKFVLDLIKEQEKLVGGLSGYEIAQEVGERILDLFITYFRPNKTSQEFIAFQQALTELDTQLKERYDINKKAK